MPPTALAPPDAEILKIGAVGNRKYYALGLAVLALNKLRHALAGYRTPRPFPVADISRSVRYDISIFREWLAWAKAYAGPEFRLRDKTVLELGPGEDLGMGLMFLIEGAGRYSAIDVNHLVRNAPREFYAALGAEYTADPVSWQRRLPENLDALIGLHSPRLRFIHSPAFNLGLVEPDSVDLAVSQAAFEHFDDVERTIRQLSRVVRSGGLLVAEIDLKTHTRWIKRRDPLNIYRYADFIYDALRFKGSPNRVRPSQYAAYLADNGWTDIRVFARSVLDGAAVRQIQPFLSRRFRAEPSMDALSVVICATRK